MSPRPRPARAAAAPNCPACRALVREFAAYCYHCGSSVAPHTATTLAPTPYRAPAPRRTGPRPAAWLAVLLILAASLTPRDYYAQAARAASDALTQIRGQYQAAQARAAAEPAESNPWRRIPARPPTWTPPPTPIGPSATTAIDSAWVDPNARDDNGSPGLRVHARVRPVSYASILFVAYFHDADGAPLSADDPRYSTPDGHAALAVPVTLPPSADRTSNPRSVSAFIPLTALNLDPGVTTVHLDTSLFSHRETELARGPRLTATMVTRSPR